MKKIVSFFIVILLVTCLGTTAFAADVNTSGGSTNKDVKATYQSGGSSATVYSVDVAWGSMEFTYNDASPGTWNPATHQYEGAGTASWTCAANANKITVTNHSNTAVAAALSYTPGASYAGIGGSFSQSTINLATAVGTVVGSAPTGSSLLTLTGALSSSVTTSTAIGSITVTIS